jgi:hypothetical protein
MQIGPVRFVEFDWVLPLQSDTFLRPYSAFFILLDFSVPRFEQCCGSMIFWCGSGSADPCLRLMDPDPDLPLFVIDLQEANKKQFFLNKFFCLLLFKGTFTSFFNNKKSKRSNKSGGIKVFLTIFA